MYPRRTANIATVFVRIVRAATFGGRWPGLSHVQILEHLLDGYNGSTYYVPIWLDYREDGTCLDVQFGARWGPSVGDVERLWERREEAKIARLWVRYFDGSGNYDEIFSLDEHGLSDRRWCRYAFDALSATSVRASRTTAVGRGRILARLEPTSVANLLAAREKSAREIRLLHAGTVVHVRRRRPTPSDSADLGLDDWDNCVDFAFARARGGEPPTESIASADREARAQYLASLVPPR